MRFKKYLVSAAVGLIVVAAPAVALPAQASTPGQTARAELAKLGVQATASSSGYLRAKFQKGSAEWTTAANHCTTLENIRAVELKNVVFTTSGSCKRATKSGDLMPDPYSGKTVHFTRSGGQVQVDHVVSLEDAWATGANKWTQARRIAFANDFADLQATSTHENESKGDKDASTWNVPDDAAYRCTFDERQVGVKYKYQLKVTRAEKKALAAQLAKCK